MLFDLIIILVVARYLKRNLSPEELTAKWRRNLTILTIVFIALFIAQFAARHFTWLIEIISHILVWGFAWIIYNKKEWIKVRPILNAMLPLLAIQTISDIIQKIFPDFYEDYNTYFDVAAVFGMLWLIAMVIINNKQRKALEKEKLKVEEKEKERKLAEKIKDTLEIQVRERTHELLKQKAELESTIYELKATQAQLIQSEKMASLGELTAGIAHEIQNPLNFVNNFSEVNQELLVEMKDEISKGNTAEAKAIADDIISNEEKIIFHGKRADAIVKGMLQHSRSSSGQKEPTDLNALCDEYLRLAYHGLRAKDKSFNAKFETSFDELIPKINIVPQDIGRVILNLITNAFYAVNERLRKALPGSNYKPTVEVSTKKEGNHVLITVKDNGNGIPDSIKEKIFQPFFTTKPAGQGTGLGLSLSYDIVKAHGGELNVETKEGEGTKFIIILPF